MARALVLTLCVAHAICASSDHIKKELAGSSVPPTQLPKEKSILFLALAEGFGSEIGSLCVGQPIESVRATLELAIAWPKYSAAAKAIVQARPESLVTSVVETARRANTLPSLINAAGVGSVLSAASSDAQVLLGVAGLLDKPEELSAAVEYLIQDKSIVKSAKAKVLSILARHTNLGQVAGQRLLLYSIRHSNSDTEMQLLRRTDMAFSYDAYLRAAIAAVDASDYVTLSVITRHIKPADLIKLYARACNHYGRTVAEHGLANVSPKMHSTVTALAYDLVNKYLGASPEVAIATVDTRDPELVGYLMTMGINVMAPEGVALARAMYHAAWKIVPVLLHSAELQSRDANDQQVFTSFLQALGLGIESWHNLENPPAQTPEYISRLKEYVTVLRSTKMVSSETLETMVNAIDGLPAAAAACNSLLGLEHTVQFVNFSDLEAMQSARPLYLSEECMICNCALDCTKEHPLDIAAAQLSSDPWQTDETQKIAVFPCGHAMHEQCTHEWFSSGNMQCPLCSAPCNLKSDRA